MFGFGGAKIGAAREWLKSLNPNEFNAVVTEYLSKVPGGDNPKLDEWARRYYEHRISEWQKNRAASQAGRKAGGVAGTPPPGSGGRPSPNLGGSPPSPGPGGGSGGKKPPSPPGPGAGSEDDPDRGGLPIWRPGVPHPSPRPGAHSEMGDAEVEGGGGLFDFLKSKKGKKTAKAAGLGGVWEKGMNVARAAEGDPVAIAKLLKEAFDSFKQNMKGAGEELGKAVKAERFGEIGGHAFGGMEKFGKALNFGAPVGVGTPIEMAGKFTKTLFESIDKLQEWTKQLHESNMQFAEFSAAMANVQAQQEMRDIQLSQERGDRRAAQAEELAKAKNRLERATAPWEDMWANVKGFFAEKFADWGAQIIEGLNKVAGVGEDKDEVTDLEKQFDKNWEDYERPNRFGGGIGGFRPFG